MTNVEAGGLYRSSILAIAGEVATYAVVAWLVYSLSIVGIYFDLLPQVASQLVLFGALLLSPVVLILRYIRVRRMVSRTGDWIDPIKVIIAAVLWLFTLTNAAGLTVTPDSPAGDIIIVADYEDQDIQDGTLVSGFFFDLLDFLPTVAPDISVASIAPEQIGKDQRVLILEVFGEQDDSGFSIRLAMRETGSDSTFWTRNYRTSKQPSEILKLRSRVTRDISNRLEAGFDHKEYERSIAIAAQTSIVPEAYEAFLSALALSRRHRSLEREQSRRIFGHLERAVEIDPDFSAAWARLANAYVSRGWFGYVIVDRQKTDEILERLDTLLGSDHFVTLRTKGIVLYHRDHNLRGGRTALLAAHRVNPRDVTTNAYLGYIERRLGLLESAVNRHEFVISVDPLFVPVATILPHIYDSQKNWDKLKAFLNKEFRSSITAKRDADLFLSQILDEKTPGRSLFRQMAEKYDALGERLVNDQYWFENQPSPEHLAFLDRLRDIKLSQLDKVRKSNEDASFGIEQVNRVLLARAASHQVIGEVEHFQSDMAQLEAMGILNRADYSARSGPRQHAQTVIFHALKGDLQTMAREMSLVERWTDTMEDRLAAGQVYSDLACAAVLARDADALVRLIEKGANTPREFSLVAIAMAVPGFEDLENDPRLTRHIQEMEADAAHLQAIILPHLEGSL